MHYKDKNLQIDIRCHTVFMNDQKIELSLKEFTVLKYLTEHPGWVFSHEEIYRNVWKEEPIDCANAVMCCISQLRKKLKVDSRNWNSSAPSEVWAISFNHSQGSNILWEFFVIFVALFGSGTYRNRKETYPKMYTF